MTPACTRHQAAPNLGNRGPAPGSTAAVTFSPVQAAIASPGTASSTAAEAAGAWSSRNRATRAPKATSRCERGRPGIKHRSWRTSAESRQRKRIT
jgi:hypothetical protein